MKKIILTKNRLKSLHLALSLDDILYEKFRRLHEDFTRRCSEWNRRKQVIRVIRKGKDYNEVLQIIREVKTDEGIYLEVR